MLCYSFANYETPKKVDKYSDMIIYIYDKVLTEKVWVLYFFIFRHLQLLYHFGWRNVNVFERKWQTYRYQRNFLLNDHLYSTNITGIFESTEWVHWFWIWLQNIKRIKNMTRKMILGDSTRILIFLSQLVIFSISRDGMIYYSFYHVENNLS